MKHTSDLETEVAEACWLYAPSQIGYPIGEEKSALPQNEATRLQLMASKLGQKISGTMSRFRGRIQRYMNLQEVDPSHARCTS